MITHLQTLRICHNNKKLWLKIKMNTISNTTIQSYGVYKVLRCNSLFFTRSLPFCEYVQFRFTFLPYLCNFICHLTIRMGKCWNRKKNNTESQTQKQKEWWQQQQQRKDEILNQYLFKQWQAESLKVYANRYFYFNSNGYMCMCTIVLNLKWSESKQWLFSSVVQQ